MTDAGPPPGAIDITDDIRGRIDLGALPMPPVRTFATPNAVFGREGMMAEDTTYLGRLTEAEAKQLTNRHFTVSRLTDMLVHQVANDARFGYESYAEVVRHAIELMMDYFREKNTFGEHQGFATDVLRRQHEMRLDSERARMRQEFNDNIRVFDRELDVARQIGDFEYVGRRLEKYIDMLENCESETQRRQLREVLAESLATKAAVLTFYRWATDPYRVPVDHWNKEWPKMAETWASWLHDWEST